MVAPLENHYFLIVRELDALQDWLFFEAGISVLGR